jgi:N-formylglutamate amidohydrolase
MILTVHGDGKPDLNRLSHQDTLTETFARTNSLPMTAYDAQGSAGAASDSTTLEASEGEGVRAAFQITTPHVLTTPLVFASPHSGRHYPSTMMRSALLDADAIRKSEDVLVDALAASAPMFGAPLISAVYARAYIDVNREPYELDQGMFQDKLPAYANARTARVAAGLGSIARVVAEGQEIYRDKLLFADARHRIDTVHRPYHQALQSLLNQAKTAFGVAILIDWHSMPSAAAGGDGRGAPDMVLGDRFGVACAPVVTSLVEKALEQRGYRVARNAPYAGGFTTEFYGRPAKGTHALQIELNRALYLDEQSLEPHEGFAKLKQDLCGVTQDLAEWNWRSAI